MIKPCPGCDGSGKWQTECCSGAGGCDCRGEILDMGPCNVCEGRGTVQEGAYDARANIKSIAGLHFIGSGPQDGSWASANRGNRTRR